MCTRGSLRIQRLVQNPFPLICCSSSLQCTSSKGCLQKSHVGISEVYGQCQPMHYKLYQCLLAFWSEDCFYLIKPHTSVLNDEQR